MVRSDGPNMVRAAVMAVSIRYSRIKNIYRVLRCGDLIGQSTRTDTPHFSHLASRVTDTIGALQAAQVMWYSLVGLCITST